MSILKQVDNIFDAFWKDHEYADFHGIDIPSLRWDIEELARKVDKILNAVREEAGDSMGRTGQYISDMCKI